MVNQTMTTVMVCCQLKEKLDNFDEVCFCRQPLQKKKTFLQQRCIMRIVSLSCLVLSQRKCSRSFLEQLLRLSIIESFFLTIFYWNFRCLFSRKFHFSIWCESCYRFPLDILRKLMKFLMIFPTTKELALSECFISTLGMQ